MGRMIVFMGPPGAGKGSLSQQCRAHYGWKQLSTGALCRKHIIEGTSIGKQIDFAIQSGKLIPDDLMVSMVKDWLKEHASADESVILDGFPRTLRQAELLTDLLKKEMPGYELVIIKLAVEDDVVVRRLGGRAICKNKDCQAVYSLYELSSLAPKVPMTCDLCFSVLVSRADDESSSIRERLRAYYASTDQLVEFYYVQGIEICELDANRVPEQIFLEFDQKISAQR